MRKLLKWLDAAAATAIVLVAALFAAVALAVATAIVTVRDMR